MVMPWKPERVQIMLNKLKAWWNKVAGPKVEDTDQPEVIVKEPPTPPPPPPHPTPGLGPLPPGDIKP
jgi:hypothetical protein